VRRLILLERPTDETMAAYRPRASGELADMVNEMLKVVFDGRPRRKRRSKPRGITAAFDGPFAETKEWVLASGGRE
jgi:hypothetical protein